MLYRTKRFYRSLRDLLFGSRPLEYRWFDFKVYTLDWLFYSWFDKLVSIKDSIIRVFIYLPIIWKDRDWDHGFALELMIFKLKRMKAHFLSKNCCIISSSAKRNAKQIAILIECLDRIQKEKYSEHLWKKYFEEQTGPEFTTDENGYLLCAPPTEKQSKIVKEIIARECQMRNFYMDYAGKILKKHSLSWWD